MRISDWSSDVCSSDLVLDLRAVGQLVAQAAEDVGDALDRAADRMQAAARGVAAGQRDVDGFGGQARVERGIFELGLSRRKRRSARVARAELGRASCRERGCQYG